MSASLPLEPVHLRRADTNERFVAFAFAGAEMMAEADPDGTLTYATGAFRSRLGEAAEAFVGRPVSTLVAPSDHEALGMALMMLTQRGRLSPMLVRMADPQRSQLAMAGIMLSGPGRPARLCLTFARPPEPATALLRPGTAQRFARAAEARVRDQTCQDIYLLEISSLAGRSVVDPAMVDRAFEQLAPLTAASELAPGRYGVLDVPDASDDALTRPGALQAALQVQGVQVHVEATRLSLAARGLTPTQAARALRQALSTFTRGGIRGLSEAGLDHELSGYMQRAGRKSDILRRVMRDGRFSLSYQPIVHLSDRRPHHYEALIRPKPIPEIPLDGPQDFIMLVEALGLADELDLRIARMACDRAIASGATVAFNISGQSVQNPVFRKRLVNMLRNHAVCAAKLVIVEVTETAEIEDTAEALATADALRSIGIPFCLDDFGAGAADVRLLRALTPDIVKLDGSYVPGIATAGRERSFIAGMVEMARAVGAEVVAERIETEAEAATLAGLGVTYGQGWLFGRPDELPDARSRVAVRAGEKESWG